MSDYAVFAAEIRKSGVINDPWIDGKPRFTEEPVILPASRYRAMCRAAEDVAAVYDEMCSIVVDEPALLDDFWGLTPFQRAMWAASEPMWHGIARADVFITADGLAFAELNCDTPTGEAEAVVLGAIAASRDRSLVDPNAELEARFVAMVEAIAAREIDDTGRRRGAVGIVYPTELTEDLALVRLYRRWFERRGATVVLGSPYNLGCDERGALLFDEPIAIALRHYKTDWWGERSAVWIGDDVPDREPLAAPFRALLSAAAEGKVAIVNPFGAVVPQNKRSMAFFWEHIHRFSPHAQAIIDRYVPVTSRLETLHPEQLFAEREDWVLKSDYGAEGDEVVIGRDVTDEAWRKAVESARPGRFIAQRYFEATANARGESVNHGVFLIAGEAAGIYGRAQAGATDERALSAAVLVDR